MSDDTPLPPWDTQEIKRRVRAQRNLWEDRRSPIVRECNGLEKKIETLEARATTLRASITTVEGAGGDATSLRAQAARIDAEVGPMLQRFDAAHAEWTRLNEVCKWAEYADDGLHWLIFAECELRRHDASRQPLLAEIDRLNQEVLG